VHAGLASSRMLSVERAPQALAFSSRNKAGPGAAEGAFAESSPLFRCRCALMPVDLISCRVSSRGAP